MTIREPCAICGADDGPLCSRACLQRAVAELDRNVDALRGMPATDAYRDRRYQLAARNGCLTSAIIRWRA